MTRWRDRIRDSGLLETLRMFSGGMSIRARGVVSPEALLFARGRYLHRTLPGRLPVHHLHRFDLPEGVERVGATYFRLELDRVTSYCGFSYAPGGWHPFQAVLEQYLRDPRLRYEASVLCLLYRRFTPGSAQEAIFGPEDPLMPPLDVLPPLHHRVLKVLWRLDRSEVERLVAEGRTGPILDDNARFMGPKTDARGTHHFERLIRVFESVRRHGFAPATFGGRRPQGYFLVRNGAYRFVASGANHRLAVLRVMGHRHVVATFLPRVPPVIDERHLHRWCSERGGAFPLAVVRAVFDRQFTADGSERADQLRLR